MLKEYWIYVEKQWIGWLVGYMVLFIYNLCVQHYKQGNQRWQTSPAAPPGVVGIIFPYILTPIPNLYDHSFPRYGQITFLTFRRPTTLTFDLKFLSVTVYPYVICMPSFIMIGWEMAEILHFEILRKHGQTNTQTHKHTNKQTWALQYLALPLWGAR